MYDLASLGRKLSLALRCFDGDSSRDYEAQNTYPGFTWFYIKIFQIYVKLAMLFEFKPRYRLDKVVCS